MIFGEEKNKYKLRTRIELLEIINKEREKKLHLEENHKTVAYYG